VCGVCVRVRVRICVYACPCECVWSERDGERIQRGYERIGEQPENEKDNKKGKQQYMSTSSY